METRSSRRRRPQAPGESEICEEMLLPRLALVSERDAAVSDAAPPAWLATVPQVERSRHLRRRVHDLIDCVADGRIYEAISEFYDPDVRLSAGAMAPMFCLDSRLGFDAEARRGVVWDRFSAEGVGVNGDTSFIECELEFSGANGKRFATRYVAIAQWCDGKIVRESLQVVR